jgi:hypothetical protein
LVPVYFDECKRIVTCGCGREVVAIGSRIKICPHCAREKKYSYSYPKLRVIVEESSKRLESTVKVHTNEEIKEFESKRR